MAQLATRTFHDELAPHFAIEETHLVPALEALGEHILAERICADHAALRELIAGVGAGGEIAPFGERLMEHVRFEERDVFERTQHRLGRDALTAIAAACREAMHRRPARSADEAQQPHSTDSASSQTTHMHSKEST
jgi:hemerythrin-like domain-containing protein